MNQHQQSIKVLYKSVMSEIPGLPAYKMFMVTSTTLHLFWRICFLFFYYFLNRRREHMSKASCLVQGHPQFLAEPSFPTSKPYTSTVITTKIRQKTVTFKIPKHIVGPPSATCPAGCFQLNKWTHEYVKMYYHLDLARSVLSTLIGSRFLDVQQRSVTSPYPWFF